MLQPDAVRRLLSLLASPRGCSSVPYSVRGLILAAHPDDETIGASAILTKLRDWHVVYLTDGAPADSDFRSPDFAGSRREYAAIRAEEAKSALAVAGVPADHMHFLSAVDQESILIVPQLVHELLAMLRELRPEIVLTHPYEGGHPDHDTAALVGRLAVQTLLQESAKAPSLLEMTSYHAEGDRRVAGEFLSTGLLPRSSSTESELMTPALNREDLARKSKMTACYASQKRVLAEFPLEPERLRFAPLYDFTQPPHAGFLWYERLGWPMTGKEWRSHATAALNQEGSFACR